jgi:hypothetical protein
MLKNPDEKSQDFSVTRVAKLQLMGFFPIKASAYGNLVTRGSGRQGYRVLFFTCPCAFLRIKNCF